MGFFTGGHARFAAKSLQQVYNYLYMFSLYLRLCLLCEHVYADAAIHYLWD